MDKFVIKIHFVVLATNPKRNKQYILSLSDKAIELPFMFLESSDLEKLDFNIIEHAQKFVFANDLELMPQLINLHSKFIEETSNQINTVYGFIINQTDNINNSYWIEYDYLTPNKYSNLIFETTQKLK